MSMEIVQKNAENAIQEVFKETSKEMSVKQFRETITKLEEMVLAIPGTVYGNQPFAPLKHTFGEGLYVREIFMPKGYVFTSRIHKEAHPYFVLKGKAIVVTEHGRMIVEAPFHGMTTPGTKRALYILEDCIWITCHRNPENKRDTDELENDLTVRAFEELPESVLKEIEK